MSENWNKSYNRINWKNYPSEDTPINETNLNLMDSSLNVVDNRVLTLNTIKLDLDTANTMVKDVTLNSSTGVITITFLNGTTRTYDTKLEKLAVNFTYDSQNQRLVITLDDGTKQYVDLSSLITEYEFTDSSTIDFSVSSGSVSAIVKDGSITGSKLQPNYLADIQAVGQQVSADATQAHTDSVTAKSYAVGGTGSRTGEDTDNAKYYAEQAAQTDIGQVTDKLNEVTTRVDYTATSGQTTEQAVASWADLAKKSSTTYNRVGFILVGTTYLYIMVNSLYANGTITGGTIINSLNNRTYSVVRNAGQNAVLTELVSNSNIASTENGATASQTLNAGSYIMHKGQFCKVTQTIAGGTTITEGVNVDSKTIGGEISEINSNLSHNLFGTAIDISSYTSTTQFVAPNDGYIIIASPLQANVNITLYVNNTYFALIETTRQGYPNVNSVFVRKGMTAYITHSSTATGYSAVFRPLI